MAVEKRSNEYKLLEEYLIKSSGATHSQAFKVSRKCFPYHSELMHPLAGGYIPHRTTGGK